MNLSNGLTENNLDNLTEPNKKILEKIVEHFSEIKKVMRDNDKLESELWRRSTSDVIESGETFYMRCCADYTLTFLDKLKRTFIDTDDIFLGIEKLKLKTNWNEDIHLYVEIKNNWKTQIIDFARNNLVYLYSWNYKNIRPDVIETLSTRAIPSSFFDNSDSIVSIAKRLWEGENIEKFLNNLEQLKSHNTPLWFQDFERRMNSKIKVNVEWDWHEMAVNKKNKSVSSWLYSVLST